MDLYRYFHPQHNPRLKKVPIRLIELGELGQASVELKNAILRAQARTESASIGGISSKHFDDLVVAMDFLIESLDTLSNAHPGDDTSTLLEMLEERKNAPGWENWASLLSQRLEMMQQYDNTIEHTSQDKSSEIEK